MSLSVIKAQEDSNRSKEQQDKNDAILPPCGACNNLVSSFSLKAKGKTHFQEIKDLTCSDVSRGYNQCRENLYKWSHHLQQWMKNGDQSDLKEWLCIQTLKVCCPENHFGPSCTPCVKLGNSFANNLLDYSLCLLERLKREC